MSARLAAALVALLAGVARASVDLPWPAESIDVAGGGLVFHLEASLPGALRAVTVTGRGVALRVPAEDLSDVQDPDLTLASVWSGGGVGDMRNCVQRGTAGDVRCDVEVIHRWYVRVPALSLVRQGLCGEDAPGPASEMCEVTFKFSPEAYLGRDVARHRPR